MNKYSLEYPLKGEDIMTILDGKCGMLEYKDLYHIDNLNEVMKDDALVILYRSSPTSAHWCCVFKNKEGIEFFDPYGLIIDDEIKPEFMTQDFINSYYHEGHKRLIELILKGNFSHINYNNYDLQQLKSNINTCGRHVACRLLFKKYSLEEYINILSQMNKGEYFDNIVLKITNKLF
jgi:hypothetical protein